MMPKRETQPADRRLRLIEAARDLFGEHPYEQVTTTQIAKTADVAYGLIAHHFGNKRGLYLAVMETIRDELATAQDIPVPGDTLEEQLRHALARHVDYIDSHQRGFLALMRGDLGSDPDLREMFAQFRWSGASRILHAIGVTEPTPVTRAAMRAWVALLDELMLERFDHQDISRQDIVDLSADLLIATLRSVRSLDPGISLTPEAAALLEGTR